MFLLRFNQHYICGYGFERLHCWISAVCFQPHKQAHRQTPFKVRDYAEMDNGSVFSSVTI